MSVQILWALHNWISLLLSFWVPHILLISTPYWLNSCKYFIQFCTLSLHSVESFLCYPEASYFDISHLSVFALIACVFEILSKKITAYTNVLQCFSVFPSNSFIASGLIFRSLIHLELIFVACEIGIKFYSSIYRYSFFSTPFIEEAALSPMCVFGIFVKNQWL